MREKANYVRAYFAIIGAGRLVISAVELIVARGAVSVLGFAVSVVIALAYLYVGWRFMDLLRRPWVVQRVLLADVTLVAIEVLAAAVWHQPLGGVSLGYPLAAWYLSVSVKQVAADRVELDRGHVLLPPFSV